MSFKTFLLGLALGGVAVNLYNKSRQAIGGDSRDDATQDLGTGPSMSGDPVGGLSRAPAMGARTDDLLSPGTAGSVSPTPEETVSERY